MYNWSVIHGIKRKPHLSVVWNWYHFVAIAILHQPRPTDSADINTRLQLSDTSSIPPMHGGFLLISMPNMMTSSNGNISALLALCAENSPVTGEPPSRRPGTRKFDAIFDVRLDKRLSKQSRRRWFETQPRPLWRQCNVIAKVYIIAAMSVIQYISECYFI